MCDYERWQWNVLMSTLEIQDIFTFFGAMFVHLYFILLQSDASHATHRRRTGLKSIFFPLRFHPFRLFLCNSLSLMCRRTNVIASGAWEIQTQIFIIGLLGQHVKFCNLCNQKGSLDLLEQVERPCRLNRLHCVLILLSRFWLCEWIGHYVQGICWNCQQGWIGATQGSSTLTPE